MLSRRGDDIYECGQTELRWYATYMKGWWYKPVTNKLGLPELEPVLEDEARRLSALPDSRDAR